MKSLELPVLGSTTFDELSKVIAVVLFAIYILGYLTLSFYFSRFGFLQTNPIRPKVLEAGLCLGFFCLVPFGLGFVVHALPSRGRPALQLFTLQALTLPFICFLILCTLPLQNKPLPSDLVEVSRSHASLPVSFHLLFLGAIILEYALPFATWMLKRIKFPIAVILMVGNSSIVWYLMSISQHRTFYWFLVASFAGLIVAELKRMGASRDPNEPPIETGHLFSLTSIREANGRYFPFSLIAVGLLVTWLFANILYDKIPSTFGGGEPIVVGLFVKPDKDGRPLPGLKDGIYYLIDSSDQGEYVLDSDRKGGVTFIPKENVSALLFSAK